MINLDVIPDSPSCLLRELGVGEELLLLPASARSLRDLYEKSKVVPLSLYDDVARSREHFCILRKERDKPTVLPTWGLVRLRDPVGSIVTCIGFHYDPLYQEYFCELSLDLPQDSLRRISMSSMRLVAHTLLPFENILLLPATLTHT